MATIPVPVVQALRSGVSYGAGVSSQLAGSGNHTIANNDKVTLLVTTTGVTNLTFTIPANSQTDGVSPTKVVALGTGTFLVGPFPSAIYGGTVTFTADVTTATLRAITT